MSRKRVRVFSPEMKLVIVQRILAGESVNALARELKIRRTLLYLWRANFRSGGPAALRLRGRPRKRRLALSDSDSSSTVGGAAALSSPERQIAELERKIGQQQLELDFFRQALRQVRGKRRASDGPGAQPSTPGSRR
jgi:transposase